MPRAQACAQHCDCSCSPWGDTRQENLHTVPSPAVGDLVLPWHRTAWQEAAYAEPASLGCWQDVSKRKPNQAWVHSLEMVNMRVGGRMRCLTSLWSCKTSCLFGSHTSREVWQAWKLSKQFAFPLQVLFFMVQSKFIITPKNFGRWGTCCSVYALSNLVFKVL